MSQEEKISEDELEKQLQEKSLEEIAIQYGYNWPSRQLQDKARNLGYRQNPKLSFHNRGGANIYLTTDILKQVFEKKQIDPDQETVYFTSKVLDTGEIKINVTKDNWSQK